MPPKRTTFMGVAASGTLAALTVAVFASNQLSGPQGVIHQYFAAAASNNMEKASELVVGTTRDFQVLTAVIQQAFYQGAKYQIVDVQRDGATARAGVVFYFPVGQQPFIVALGRRDREWKIDANGTLYPHRQPGSL